MTDGAARTLLDSGNQSLIDFAVPHLTTRNPDDFWTSGQWMTERTGGSDVGLSETTATIDADKNWKLHGTKWFTSATTSEIALALARPDKDIKGGKGLALFLVRVLDDDKSMSPGIQVNRLKDKLGTRKVPTAELTLDGALATPVQGLSNGVKNITPMLNVTRTWNAMASVWGMRRGIALATSYAQKRFAFGSTLSQKPLHMSTLAHMIGEFNGAFVLAFKTAELLGKIDTKTARPEEIDLFRIIAPLAKLTTGKQAVSIASETLEAFGGAGYIEDTGLPRLLADAQVLPIWEGTTNVLSMDVLRVLQKSPQSLTRLLEYPKTLNLEDAPNALSVAIKALKDAQETTQHWVKEHSNNPRKLESDARLFSLSLGRLMQLTLLIEHAISVNNQKANPQRSIAAANQFASHGVCQFRNNDMEVVSNLCGF